MKHFTILIVSIFIMYLITYLLNRKQINRYIMSLFECSTDHEQYKSGAESCIKHGYFINHRIQCPECGEYLEPDRNE